MLIVEDYAPFRRFVVSILQKQQGLQIICEVPDGLESVQKAEELLPDLVLLDIGLPNLNGIEAAQRICKISPQSKILFLSENRSWDIVEEALRSGACGYVVKSDAESELLPAVKAVLKGERFVSTSVSRSGVADPNLADPNNEHTVDLNGGAVVLSFPPRNRWTACRHKAGFYPDDLRLLDDVMQFIRGALTAGSTAVVIATEPHRESLLLRLQEHGTDIADAIERGRYISVDAADAVSEFVINGMLDPVRLLNLFRDLMARAAGAAKGEQASIAVFGEGADLLWAQGNAEAAIQVEEVCSQLIKTYNLDMLCGYSLNRVRGDTDRHTFQRICAEHSAVLAEHSA